MLSLIESLKTQFLKSRKFLRQPIDNVESPTNKREDHDLRET